MFENIGIGELTLILLVIIIFFGPKKIPDLARGLGKGISEFKKAMRDVETELEKPVVTPQILEPPQLNAPASEHKASASTQVNTQADTQAKAQD